MITAKNYAAKAQAGLREFASAVEKTKGYHRDAEMARMMADNITTAQHFAIPDGGLIFDDDMRGIRGVEVRLPYKSVTVEYFVEQKQNYQDGIVYVPKRLIYATEFERKQFPAAAHLPSTFGDRGIAVFAANEVDGKWVPVICGYAISQNWDSATCLESVYEVTTPFGTSDDKMASFYGVPIFLAPDSAKMALDRFGVHEGMRLMMHDIALEVRALMEFCEAMSCSNVCTDIVQSQNKKINDKRIKNGKLPIYETKVLAIEVPGKRGVYAFGATEDRRSPRQHLRRGHVRVIGDGRRIWVNSCVVGSKETGVVEKSYRVSKAA